MFLSDSEYLHYWLLYKVTIFRVINVLKISLIGKDTRLARAMVSALYLFLFEKTCEQVFKKAFVIGGIKQCRVNGSLIG